jgi:hypothetical protein
LCGSILEVADYFEALIVVLLERYWRCLVELERYFGVKIYKVDAEYVGCTRGCGIVLKMNMCLSYYIC